MFTQVTPVTSQLPITLDEAKSHLRLPIDDFDGLLASLIDAAADIVETYINGPIFTGTYQYFPDDSLNFPVVIPKGNVQGVTTFEFRSADGVWHTLTNASWDFTVQGGRCKVFLKPFVVIAWPVLYTESPFRITFTAGLADTPDTLPERVKQAVKILVGNLFNQTDDAFKVPEMLLSQYRYWFAEML